MFILRRISGNGVQMNHTIGKDYTHIDRHGNYDDFCKTFKLYFERKHVADLDPESDDNTKRCYAFIVNGAFVQPLYANQKAFVMTECGNTFANVSQQ